MVFSGVCLSTLPSLCLERSSVLSLLLSVREAVCQFPATMSNRRTHPINPRIFNHQLIVFSFVNSLSRSYLSSTLIESGIIV
eukprot:m.345624 g.345624  ORF g.345624 m.345624 type:complete len:82 (-) comp55814_c2_seq26:880-1125(-)